MASFHFLQTVEQINVITDEFFMLIKVMPSINGESSPLPRSKAFKEP